MKNVRLDDELMADAAIHAKVSGRSTPKQIEFWAKIGRIAVDNPDLSYEFIKEALLATEEINVGRVSKYVRRER